MTDISRTRLFETEKLVKRNLAVLQSAAANADFADRQSLHRPGKICTISTGGVDDIGITPICVIRTPGPSSPRTRKREGDCWGEFQGPSRSPPLTPMPLFDYGNNNKDKDKVTDKDIIKDKNNESPRRSSGSHGRSAIISQSESLPEGIDDPMAFLGAVEDDDDDDDDCGNENNNDDSNSDGDNNNDCNDDNDINDDADDVGDSSAAGRLTVTRFEYRSSIQSAVATARALRAAEVTSARRGAEDEKTRGARVVAEAALSTRIGGVDIDIDERIMRGELSPPEKVWVYLCNKDGRPPVSTKIDNVKREYRARVVGGVLSLFKKERNDINQLRRSFDLRSNYCRQVEITEFQSRLTLVIYPSDTSGSFNKDNPVIYMWHDSGIEALTRWAVAVRAVVSGSYGDNFVSRSSMKLWTSMRQTPAGEIAYHLTMRTQRIYRDRVEDLVFLHGNGEDRQDGPGDSNNGCISDSTSSTSHSTGTGKGCCSISVRLASLLADEYARLTCFVARCKEEYGDSGHDVDLVKKLIAIALEMETLCNFQGIVQILLAVEDNFHGGHGASSEVDPAWQKVPAAMANDFKRMYWEYVYEEHDGRGFNAWTVIKKRKSEGSLPFLLPPASIGSALDAIDRKYGLTLDAKGANNIGSSSDKNNNGDHHNVPCIGRSSWSDAILTPNHLKEVDDFIDEVVIGLAYGECRRGRGCGRSCDLIEDSLRRIPKLSPGEGRALARHRDAVLRLMQDSKGRRAFSHHLKTVAAAAAAAARARAAERAKKAIA